MQELEALLEGGDAFNMMSPLKAINKISRVLKV